MDYLEENINPDDTTDRVEFNNSCKNISMDNHYGPTNLFEMISTVKEEYYVEIN